MNRLTRLAGVMLAALLGIGIALMGASGASAASPVPSAAFISMLPPGCGVDQNLGTIADDYISKCRKASVRTRFPTEYLDRTLAQIKVDRTTPGRTAWKLLTDSRFAKP
ncbi:hypothetical protein [Microtetraspora malaysiensis]|uniref:hypothetical protein n=1 Tax=Microtetraspora malaysiensis TaxID=161358 RepID=UPI003D8ADD81